jgi:hypothetical protein
MRKWFSSEFTWRLYVVVQLVSLILSGLLLLKILEEGKLPYNVKYQNIYKEIEIDPVKYAAAIAECERLSDEPKGARGLFLEPPSPRDSCLGRINQLRRIAVGREFAGMDFNNEYVAILFLLILPFVVVRVPSWLWQGWREG